MQNRSMRAVLLFLIFYVVFGVYLTQRQEQIIYQPFPQDFFNCPALRDASPVTFQGTRMYTNIATNTPTVILYHGNAGSACDRAFYTDLFDTTGYGYLLVEYAGYSKDPEPPSHDRIKQDVRNVISYLEQENVKDVAVVGESIGTGVASYHTSIAPPERLLLVTPFTDLTAIARTRFWFYPTGLLVDNAYDNVALLSDYRGPVTIIHGTEDSLIPFRFSQSLFTTLKTPNKQLVPINGADHNDLFGYPESFTAIEDFLNRNE